MLKQADPTQGPYYGDVDNVFRAEAVKKLLHLGLLGVGLGGAAAGAKGVYNMVADNTSPPPKLPLRQQVIKVPVPSRWRREDDSLLTKEAKLPPTTPGTDLVAKGLDAVNQMRMPGGSNWTWLQDRVWNPGARGPMEMPMTLPIGAALGIGGAALGYHVANSAINSGRANETESELETAKRRYEQALAGGLKSAGVADDRVLAMAEAYEKSANLDGAMAPVTGAYLVGLGTVAGLSGMGVYNWMRDNDEGKAVEDALKMRRDRLFTSAPPTILASPEPGEPDDSPSKIELSGLPARLKQLVHHKAANLSTALGSAEQQLTVKRQAEQQRFQQQIATIANGGVPPEPKPAKPAADSKPAAPSLPSVVR